MANRINTIERNGHLDTIPQAKAPKAKKPRVRKPKAVKLSAANHLHHYAYAGVAVMAALSAALNGYANALHSPSAFAGWLMGIVVPVIILLLGKVSTSLYQRGAKGLCYVTAAAGIGLLLLSVWHCATSIGLLTGSPLLLALPMACAIDVGFVCCEVALVLE